MNIPLIFGFLFPIFGLLEYLPVLFLMIIIRPLWILSKKRPALNLIFSKACSSILLQICISIHELAYNKAAKNVPTYMLFWFLYVCRFHIPILALDRLYAVFWPFSYKKWWTTKRSLGMICLAIWLSSILPAIVFIFNILSDFSWIPDLELKATIVQTIMGIIWPAGCYIAIFIEVKRRKAKGEIGSMEQDIVRMCIVFFCSMVPYIFWLGLYLADQFLQNSQFNQQTEYTRVEYSASFLVIYNVLMTLITLNNSLTNICDDIALVCLYKDYRKLVRQQMRWIFHFCTCHRFYKGEAIQPMAAMATTTNAYTNAKHQSHSGLIRIG